MKKTIAILVALMLCVSLCSSAFADNEGWTIFVYICGSNLESEDGFASENMQEMIEASAGSGVRFVVETGGASAWQNDASPDELDRFEIAGGNSTIVDRQPQASMAIPRHWQISSAGVLQHILPPIPAWFSGITAVAALPVCVLMTILMARVLPCGRSTMRSTVRRTLCLAVSTSSAMTPA